MRSVLAPGNRGATLDRMRQTVLEGPIPLLRRIQAPTLWVWGQQDGMIPYANSADYVRELPWPRLYPAESRPRAAGRVARRVVDAIATILAEERSRLHSRLCLASTG
jgi:hypothetical protein